MDSENTLMTEITIRDYGSSGLVHYTIRVDDWEIQDCADTLDGAFKCITHKLKWWYREYERDNEND
jgi:hypothetical protein